MVKTRVDLYGIEETVVRPAIITVVEGIKNLLSFSNDIYTVYNVSDKIIKNKDKLGNLLGSNIILEEGISTEAVDKTAEGYEIDRIPNKPDQVPVYKDDDIKSCFIPIYQNRKVTINFKYFSKSKSKVQALLNRIRLMSSNESMYKLHELEYYYVLPNFILQLLNNINTLKNKRDIVAKDFEDYLSDTFDTRAEFIWSSDNILNKATLGIREAQLGVQGYIVDDLHDLTVEEDETYGGHFINFNYEFCYEKPTAIQLVYPILVYNTFIDKQFRNFIKKDEQPSPKAFRSYGTRGLATFNNPQSSLTILDNKYYLTIPSYDNYILNKPTEFTVRMFSVMVKVSDTDLNELFNINEMPGIKFKDNILYFLMKLEREFLNKLHESVFHIELYKNGRIDPINKVVLEEDGTLHTVYPMDLKCMYHVVFCILTDLDYLSKEAKERIRQFIRDELERAAAKQAISDTLLSSYLTVLSIPPNETQAALAKDEKTENVIFNLKDYKWRMFFTKEVVVVLTGVLEKK